MKVTYHSPIGKLILIVENGRLVYVNWDSPECEKKLARFLSPEITIENPEDSKVIDDTIKQLEEYFSGNRVTFDLQLEFKGTPFQTAVWKELKNVEYSLTVSYKELAKKCGYLKSYRAVANACGANPIAIIVPCHRVLASGGKPGGYTGGLDKKIALLEIEKHEFRKEKRIK